MIEKTYVSVGENIEFKKFNVLKKPLGWIELNYLKNKLSNDVDFRNKFNQEEIQLINNYK